MNKKEFLAAVGKRLKGLRQSDIDEALSYYEEMIDERMEDGLTEEEAVAAMGPAEDIAEQILMDMPLAAIVKAKAGLSRKPGAWEIVLLVLGSPVWLPLLFAAAIVFLAVYVVIWSAVAALYAADIVVAACSVCGVAGAVLLAIRGFGPQTMLFFGAGLVCAGTAILMLFVCNKAARGVVVLGKLIVFWIKARFIRKGETK